MKKLLLFSCLFILLLTCKNNSEDTENSALNETKTNEFAIVIHGGAGTILKKNMSD